jgi:hypothetical protein
MIANPASVAIAFDNSLYAIQRGVPNQTLLRIARGVRTYSITFFSIGSTVTPVLRSHVSARSI